MHHNACKREKKRKMHAEEEVSEKCLHCLFDSHICLLDLKRRYSAFLSLSFLQ